MSASCSPAVPVPPPFTDRQTGSLKAKGVCSSDMFRNQPWTVRGDHICRIAGCCRLRPTLNEWSATSRLAGRHVLEVPEIVAADLHSEWSHSSFRTLHPNPSVDIQAKAHQQRHRRNPDDKSHTASPSYQFSIILNPTRNCRPNHWLDRASDDISRT